MGYTHYWDFKDIESKELEEVYQKAISQCETVVKAYNLHMKLIDFKNPDRLSGYTAHAPSGQYKGLKVNGTKELSCEDFIMREHYSQNESNFCKTAQKPYDTAVVACLIILKYYLEDNFNVESDGDTSDWIDGLELARDILKLKGLDIPKSIRRGQLRGVS